MSKNRSRNKTAAKVAHRSGFVSILGRPNVGKSTLLNALVGAKIAIVADKPQTTRTTVQGVWTDPATQIVFLDTPGIHAAQSLINRRMMKAVADALDGRDLLLYVVDVKHEPAEEDRKALEWVKRSETKAIAVLNKIDLLENKALLLPLIAAYQALHDFDLLIPVSATTGEGVEDLRKAIVERLPAGPAYFPADYLTDQPERFLLTEIVREKILHVTRQEVPHSIAVTIDEWDESPRLAKVSATIHVERAGQKPIVMGTGASRLKEIGTAARLECEALFGKKIFLKLFVKVSEKWRDSETFLNDLDWRTNYSTAEPENDAPEAAEAAGNEHNEEE
ncbi:MAG: GTPase Era [Bryobacteraceae bacterium]|nr:GTPase Era [Bryobacteraceae bacterium]